MILLILRPESRFWLGLVALFVGGLAYIVFKLTKGYTGGYLKAGLGESMRTTFLLIHGFGSLILALIIPNNYLADTEFFGTLYKQNDLWIAASILGLLFLFLFLIGSLLTWLTRLTKNRNEKISK
jgi:hypothetical protein